MNARMETFDLIMEGRQVDEAVTSILHTLVFQRSMGKFSYTSEESYSVGTIGYTDVDCNYIDLTYVCCSSPQLDKVIKDDVSQFSEMLRGNSTSNGTGTGQITLEFFQKKPNRWLLPQESVPWEVWTLRLELIALSSESERQISREQVGENITEKILYISEVVNRQHYLPNMPNRSELNLVFDTTFADIQPYLFKIHYSLAGVHSNRTELSWKKVFREMI